MLFEWKLVHFECGCFLRLGMTLHLLSPQKAVRSVSQLIIKESKLFLAALGIQETKNLGILNSSLPLHTPTPSQPSLNLMTDDSV